MATPLTMGSQSTSRSLFGKPARTLSHESTPATASAPPPATPPETPLTASQTAPQGRFDGLYRLDGFTLRRGDGLALVACYRPGDVGPRGSNRYLALASSPARPFVGNLYRAPGLDGAEFDDKVHRYRIERVDAERYRIRTLYRKGARPARRGRQ